MREEILKLETPAGRAGQPSFLDRWARTQVHAQLARLQAGEITFVEAGQRKRFGHPGSALRATVFVDDPRFYRALVLAARSVVPRPTWTATGGAIRSPT